MEFKMDVGLWLMFGSAAVLFAWGLLVMFGIIDASLCLFPT
jgi:hypothetical protein